MKPNAFSTRKLIIYGIIAAQLQQHSYASHLTPPPGIPAIQQLSNIDTNSSVIITSAQSGRRHMGRIKGYGPNGDIIFINEQGQQSLLRRHQVRWQETIVVRPNQNLRFLSTPHGVTPISELSLVRSSDAVNITSSTTGRRYRGHILGYHSDGRVIFKHSNGSRSLIDRSSIHWPALSVNVRNTDTGRAIRLPRGIRPIPELNLVTRNDTVHLLNKEGHIMSGRIVAFETNGNIRFQGTSGAEFSISRSNINWERTTINHHNPGPRPQLEPFEVVEHQDADHSPDNNNDLDDAIANSFVEEPYEVADPLHAALEEQQRLQDEADRTAQEAADAIQREQSEEADRQRAWEAHQEQIRAEDEAAENLRDELSDAAADLAEMICDQIGDSGGYDDNEW